MFYSRMIKSTLFFLLLLFVFLPATNAQPWTDESRFEFNIGSKSNKMWVNWIPNIESEYIKRFGAFPHIMLWKDAPEDKEIGWGIFCDMSRKDFEKDAPWTQPVRWKDVSQYFYWKLENVLTGDVNYIPVTMDKPNENLDYNDYYTIGWSHTLLLDPWTLPLDDAVAYRVLPQIWMGDPPNGKLVATDSIFVHIVKAKHETALDDYQDAFWNNEFDGNPDLCVTLLDSFPFNYILLSSLSDYYMRTENCDSLKWATSQMFYSLENRLDDFYIPQSYFGRNNPENDRLKLTPARRKKYLDRVEEVCGDTLLPPPWRTEE